MKKLAVILGSGYSYNAGLPLAKDIDNYFMRDNSKMLLHFLSDEWKWYDLATNVEKHNGNASYDRIAYGYILNELVKTYVKDKGSFINYEDFYQFIIDGLNKPDFLKNICKKANEVFDKDGDVKNDNQFYDKYTLAFNHLERNQIYNMINYLIGGLLYLKRSTEEFASSYDPFFSYLSKFEQRDIFTLNHDYILEALLIRKEISFDDGFSDHRSELLGDNKKKLRCFKGIFNSSYNLIKLHGSIDLYKYVCAEQNGSILSPMGEYIYFKTHDYYEKQRPVRINIETGDIVQNFHWNITPQFITGTKKDELIKTDKMYNMLYSELKQKICHADTLLIIGYSFRDKHVDKQIKLALSKGNLNRIINVNPCQKFPFASNKSIEIINLKQIADMDKN